MSTAVLRADADLRTRVELTLRRQLEERTPPEEAYGGEFARLWRLALAHATGGKLVRPLLLLETHRALLDPPDPDAVAPAVVEVAALIEQLHFAFLLHDDIIDGDLRRRGRANLIGTLSADRGTAADDGARLHWARSSALLMGDLLLTSALVGAARTELPAPVRGRLLDAMDHAVTETIAGEHGDVGLADGMIRPDLDAILAATANKTASYSFALPLRFAAILAGADSETEALLAAIGRRVGLAYQLQDDLLSTFGGGADHGKDPYSDLREGKQTAIIAFARMTSAWPAIAPRFGAADLQAVEGEVMRGLLRDCGAERFAARLVEEEFAAADAAVSAAAGRIPSAALRVLRDLITSLEGRRS